MSGYWARFLQEQREAEIAQARDRKRSKRKVRNKAVKAARKKNRRR